MKLKKKFMSNIFSNPKISKNIQNRIEKIKKNTARRGPEPV